jgi:thiol-disulfide isomerase/thioredoxin/tetratricopeptide (TPR) repeat protein
MRLRTMLFLLFFAATAHATTMSELMEGFDEAAAVRLFATIAQPTPEDRGLYVQALVRMNRSGDARRVAEELMRDAPSSPWAWFARANTADPNIDTGVADTQKMMELAGPEPPDVIVKMRVDHLSYADRFSEAYAVLDARPASLALQVARAQVLSMEAMTKNSDEDRQKATAQLVALAAAHPQSLAVQNATGFLYIGMRRAGEGYPYAKRAAELSPALSVHARYWETLAVGPGRTPEERRAEFEADVAGLLKTRGDWPELWLRVARAYEKDFAEPKLAEEWRARVLRDAYDSPEAGIALYERFLGARKEGDVKKDPELLAKVTRLLREALAHPRLAGSYRDGAASQLLTFITYDPKATNEDLLAAINAATATDKDFRRASFVSLLLSDRNLRPEQALKLARATIETGKKYIAETPPNQIDARTSNRIRAMGHDTLGWAMLKSGDLAGARTQLLAALELDPSYTQVHYHLGQWYELTGKRDLAEKSYRQGMLTQSMGGNPNEAALVALGGQQAVAKGRAANMEKRRRDVLAARLARPAPAPPFRLDGLDGQPVSLASLKGKVVVVNFWGIWCGYCVEELPELQQLRKKYARDPKVAILTINNDGNPEKVRKWMREKKYDFPVLLDAGFAQKEGVRAWPTTWFIDREGRMAFEKKGWTEHLVEEFQWRIEALRE